MSHRIYMTDKELASVVEVSVPTLSRIFSGFYHETRKDKYTRHINLRDAAPDIIGGRRRWRISRVADILGITPEELEMRIS